MEKSPAGDLSTITDIFVLLWNRHGRRILIFFHATSLCYFTSVLDTSWVLLFFMCFFVMSLNVGNTMCFFAPCSECPRGENFNHARVNGGCRWPNVLISAPSVQVNDIQKGRE